MRVAHRARPAAVFMACAAALLACRDSARPDAAPARVAGRYVLESVSGPGPATGAVTLAAAGSAERRVRYRLGEGALSAEHVAHGSFRLSDGGELRLSLRVDGAPSPSTWLLRAEVAGGILTIQSQGPADEPIVETYRRQ